MLTFTCMKYDKDNSSKAVSMTSLPNQQQTIIRTERGLTIAGTRITIYDVMDYVTTQYPPKFIRGLFDLTEEQINAALAYIETNRAEVEAEYQQVLKEAEELRQYYEEQNRELIARIAAQPPSLELKLLGRNFVRLRQSVNLRYEFSD